MSCTWNTFTTKYYIPVKIPPTIAQTPVKKCIKDLKQKDIITVLSLVNIKKLADHSFVHGMLFAKDRIWYHFICHSELQICYIKHVIKINPTGLIND